MAVAAFDNFAVLLQIQQTTRNLASSMNQDATAWLAMAQGQTVPQPTLAKYVTDAGASYRNIIAQASAFISAHNATATAACALIGATIADLQAYASPLSSVANGIQTADLSSYAAIISACNQITGAVPAPATLWPGT